MSPFVLSPVIQAVVNTLEKSSADYPKAQKELEELAKLVTPAQVTAQPGGQPESELAAPQPLPTPKVNPPINLPADLGPETTVTPTPTTPLNPVTPTP